MPKAKPLAIDLLRIDGDTQCRQAIHEDTVEDYASIITENGADWPFPPVDVFHDGTDYFVGDGFHRVLGAQRTKRASIPCYVHKGTATDAKIFGMTANDKHGLRMTRADKRACVEWLLDNGGRMTQTEIAAKSGTSRRLVSFVVAERKAKNAQFAHSEDALATPKPPKPPAGTKEYSDTFEPEDFDDEESENDPDDLAKKNKTLAHSYRDKLARAICDYHEVAPNRKERDRLVKLVQGVKLW